MNVVADAATHWRRNLRGGDAEHELHGPRPARWWTGPTLGPDCPGMGPSGTLTALPLPDLSRCTRAALRAYLDNGWALTEALFASLQGEEAFYRPPSHRLRHPMIFYYAHPAVLYVNKLVEAGLTERVQPYYERIFETGVDEMSWDDMSKNDMEWPSVADVRAYRRQVYERLCELIDTHPAFGPAALPIGPASPAWALAMGFEHERIHIETSAVLIRELPVELVRRPAAWPVLHPSHKAVSETAAPVAGSDYPLPKQLEVPAGRVRIGKPAGWPSYGWDNEYGQREAHVRPFRASKQLTSNGELLEFIRAGGYAEQRFWSREGWTWRTFRDVGHPTFWVPHEGGYRLRTQFEVVPMPWSWPAEVNYHEARAYCAWRSERDGVDTPYRVLTEAEHHRLRDAAWTDGEAGPARDPVMTGDGRQLGTRGLNANLAHGSPWPVDAGAPTSAGARDVLGNLWEWCEDHFHPLEGAEVHPLYDDFSTPCYDGQHHMMLGGAFISAGDEASIFARFHFRPHFHQHTGFRLARSGDGDPACDAVDLSGIAAAGSYETEQMQREYLALHYGEAGDAMPFPLGLEGALEFPRRCAELAAAAAERHGVALRRALDIGCSVGRSTFELARSCPDVLGLDYSMVFVETARALQRRGWFDYRLKETGELDHARTARVPADIERERVAFRQADACALPPELYEFDLVLMANVICRLPSPKACLGRMGGPRGMVRPGGLLVLTSPYTWMAQYTPRPVWLGGYTRPDGSVYRPVEAIQKALGEEFELVEQQDMPLLIREHLRKYQLIVADATVWRRAPDA